MNYVLCPICSWLLLASNGKAPQHVGATDEVCAGSGMKPNPLPIYPFTLPCPTKPRTP